MEGHIPTVGAHDTAAGAKPSAKHHPTAIERSLGGMLAATVAPNFPKGLMRGALRALRSAGYSHVEHLHGVPEKDIVRLHGIGDKAMALLRAALAERGLAMRGD